MTADNVLIMADTVKEKKMRQEYINKIKFTQIKIRTKISHFYGAYCSAIFLFYCVF